MMHEKIKGFKRRVRCIVCKDPFFPKSINKKFCPKCDRKIKGK